MNLNNPPDYNAKEDEIALETYDPNWPKLAEQEIQNLTNALSMHQVCDIQHMGSTSIPGLEAKPIIDLMIAVRTMDEAQPLISPIEELGYSFWTQSPKDKLFFVKGMPPYGKKRTHHIHIVTIDGEHWQNRLLFREFMREHPQECKKYLRLKRKLAQDHRYDREAYTDAKTEFVKQVLKKARIK